MDTGSPFSVPNLVLVTDIFSCLFLSDVTVTLKVSPKSKGRYLYLVINIDKGAF